MFMMVDASTRGVWLARGPAGVPCPWLAVSCGLLSGLVTNMSYVAVECDADPGARRCGLKGTPAAGGCVSLAEAGPEE